jgi:Ca2+/Na+ antiporter
VRDMMKLSLKHIGQISGILIVLILILIVITTLYGEFNVIIWIMLVLFVATLVIFIMMGGIEHNKKKTEKKVLIAVKNELEYNLQILGHNQSIIDEEIELIEDNKFSDMPKRNKLILEPLLPLKTGFWDIIIVDLFPDEIKKSELFVKIRDIDMHANKINEQIKSRENYKNVNIDAYDISSRVKSYDKMILKDIDKLRKSLMKLGMQIYKLC